MAQLADLGILRRPQRNFRRRPPLLLVLVLLLGDHLPLHGCHLIMGTAEFRPHRLSLLPRNRLVLPTPRSVLNELCQLSL